MLETNLIKKKSAIVSGSTRLLMHFDNNFQDACGGQVFATGTSTNTNRKFGAASASFGAGQFARLSANDAQYTGFTEATLECWLYKTGVQAWGGVICTGTSPNDYTAWDMSSSQGYDMAMSSRANGGGVLTTPIIPTNGIPLNQWVHLAAVWKNKIVTGFVNGTKKLSGPMDNWILRPGMSFDIGNIPYANNYPLVGLLDELRLSATALYSDSFTPPSGPFSL